MTLLSANLNKIALLRNTRTLGIPSVVHAARLVLGAGAHGITVHPRPDGRHVRSPDVRELAAVLRDRPGAEFNIEGNPFHGLLEFVREVRPAPRSRTPCSDATRKPRAPRSDRGWASTPVTISIWTTCRCSCARCRKCWKCPSGTR